MDTTRVAELDIALHRVSDGEVEQIVAALVAVPISPKDVGIGSFQLRRIGAWDVAFTNTRDGGVHVVTVGAVEPAMQRDRLEQRLKQIALIATFRGATGL